MERYIRQITLSEVGEEGQQKISNSSVVIIGVGALGSSISMLLVAAGVGRVGIVDYDVVSRSNLSRQLLYRDCEVGLPKVECAKKRLSEMNPECNIECHKLKLDQSNIDEIIAHYDIVIDGCDNVETRYIIDEATQRVKKPYIYGAIDGFQGQVSIFNTAGANSYSDLFPRSDAPQSATPPPVSPPTPAIIGSMEANETLKLIVGCGEPLIGRLFTIDLRDYSTNLLTLC